ncbi:hypothetical protein A2865_03980 [Candidatus Woesebacteria bacterium RIFCSPHIGHO2_01_FULL_39_17]|uniref:Alpha-L-glutamate ligase, RimK family n=2 Tax=Candidatus Woeseibacteriota TaxID=1752722 RepID=A0A0G0PVE4_9BACT|nr:MAG: Alpha-L-glutamate ligase, RimK family [Candidatus Woesebacteria bacterium GW2011_GWB1_39_10b]OGM23257.1 MAG: hypothetical protein A2865_03980 [Candidatus Woesebacteria bacterium RIFCSPHIGHO2_01_FULL_39_17]OGM62299.1 MAG: hypothetical protein A3A52_00720 [Candidatus Woesebacteria bacterium RIFCSPLOWO2_01_FULL_39_14]
MRILIVGLKRNPQFKRVREEGEKRGHIVDGCLATELVIYVTPETFEPTLRGKSLKDYDLIYIWAVGRRRWEWYTAANFLNRQVGTIIVNKKIVDPSYNFYLTPASDYLKQRDNSLPFPKSAIVFDAKSVRVVIEQFEFPLIVKVSEGRQGRGVFKADSLEDLEKVIEENKEKSPSFVIREFIPNDGDIRVFTVGFKAIGAMKRIPTKEGEFRSNISLGGRGEKIDLEKYPEIRKIAEKLSEVTAMEIAGVDIVLNRSTAKPYILEINPGPQFTGFEKYTGINAALEIINYFEKLHLQKNGGSD